MRASIQQIETFYWVARLGGFHAAARHQHLTQPAVSARVQELEELLGAKLFDRSKQRTELTALGGRLLSGAERILRLSDEFSSAAKRPNPMRGLLRLGTTESTAMFGLTELLYRLKAEYADLCVELTIDIGSSLSRRLNAKELDLTILMDPVASPHVIDEPIGQAQLQWVASSSMVLPERELLPQDLATMPIVLTPPPSALFSLAAQWFASAGCSLDNYTTCNSIALITNMVAAGHGISVLPTSVVNTHVERGQVQCLLTKPSMFLGTYYVSFPRDEFGPDASRLVDIARQVLGQGDLLVPCAAGVVR
jgi:DNA-binding transcriptional LysR family regulator